jgi:flagellar hook-basal body complex protein FliE
MNQLGGVTSGIAGLDVSGSAWTGMALQMPTQVSVAPPFGGLLQSMIEQTSALDAKASQAVTGLIRGQGIEIHDAMMATQKADMAFELALQVRNKAVGAYQQMMSMQF